MHERPPARRALSDERSRGAAPYAFAVVSVGAVTAILAPFQQQINSTTIALALLLVVLFIATGGGVRPAFVASVLGMLCFNFFFLPPLYTFTIADPDNWVALFAFLVTGITAGQLSARARRRAEEAERGRREIERLYTELRDAFDRASRAEALRQSEQLKSALVDAVTHDLRTPLTSIIASAATLIEGAGGAGGDEPPIQLDPATQRELLDVILEEADRLNRSVGSLVEIARIEAGQMQLRRRWTAVEEILTEALARAARFTRGHRLEVEGEEDLPSLFVDGRALAEVVYTVVENAAKYSPAGTRIRITSEAAGDGIVTIAVEDEGPGIPEELREHVFEKFFRIANRPATGVASPAGTGMGLAIARGIVEAHEGKIWAEAGPGGRGTRVVFTIPVGDTDD